MKRILVVDDDENVVRFLERGLVLEGFKVVGCVTTEAALKSFGNGTPDLVILDWVMPGLSGDDFMLRLREQHPTLPVIVLSARNMRNLSESGHPKAKQGGQGI